MLLTLIALQAETETKPFMSHGEWVISVITFAYVLVSILTLLVIKRQADIAERQVRSSDQQFKVFLESQKPQIVAEADSNPTQTLADRIAPRVQIAVFNKGLTPAYDYIYESWIEVLPEPFQDFSEAVDYFKSENPSVIYPGQKPHVLNVPIRKGITEQELANLRQLRVRACVRIRVEYRDAFSPEKRWYVNFGFAVLPNGLGFLPKYNDSGQVS
jgi:hypothetical protein